MQAPKKQKLNDLPEVRLVFPMSLLPQSQIPSQPIPRPLLENNFKQNQEQQQLQAQPKQNLQLQPQVQQLQDLPFPESELTISRLPQLQARAQMQPVPKSSFLQRVKLSSSPSYSPTRSSSPSKLSRIPQQEQQIQPQPSIGLPTKRVIFTSADDADEAEDIEDIGMLNPIFRTDHPESQEARSQRTKVPDVTNEESIEESGDEYFPFRDSAYQNQHPQQQKQKPLQDLLERLKNKTPQQEPPKQILEPKSRQQSAVPAHPNQQQQTSTFFQKLQQKVQSQSQTPQLQRRSPFFWQRVSTPTTPINQPKLLASPNPTHQGDEPDSDMFGDNFCLFDEPLTSNTYKNTNTNANTNSRTPIAHSIIVCPPEEVTSSLCSLLQDSFNLIPTTVLYFMAALTNL